VNEAAQIEGKDFDMAKRMSPRVWYLVGIGAAAFVMDRARRLLSRRRNSGDMLDDEATVAPSPTESEAVVPIMTGKSAAVIQKSAEDPPGGASSDDLTRIKGIGPAYARRLAEAGINTYAGIALATPEMLREATNALAGADVQGWIDQARSLSGKS
jgi:predicted flap endonuclease-1-like 5' DNA nuclease